MKSDLINLINKMNPWLADGEVAPLDVIEYVDRQQTDKLLLPDWDKLWLILVGPRRAGKTTLGKVIARNLVKKGRFKSLLYLNCDFLEVRQWLQTPLFIDEAIEYFKLDKPIIFIDEVQRLENPGLILKGIADLKFPIKMLASGSSQLEIKSKVQEHLTGRHLEALIFPLSYQEIGEVNLENVIYGCYPEVVLGHQKELILKQLYQDYINKDIVEILKIGKPDIMQQLLTLIAHSSGQLVNYNQLAIDCRASIKLIQNYCNILEKTYTIFCIKPFVGNKRKEVVANPVYYFIDNGFRNQVLRRFTSMDERNDSGLLIESAILQEILKFREQHFYDYNIHYWRTRSGAEVDFVLYKNEDELLPIEVKYRKMQKPTVPRALRSFIDAYKPKNSIIITKDFNGKININNSCVHFVPFNKMLGIFEIIVESLHLTRT